VSVLHEVHAELEGMASILNEGARQSQVMVEITTASLTALQAVINELKTSRESADRSNKALFLANGRALRRGWGGGGRCNSRVREGIGRGVELDSVAPLSAAGRIRQGLTTTW
jgi:hypothetical protein